MNRLGESAYDKQAYVPYYKTLDPLNPQVRRFQKNNSNVSPLSRKWINPADYIRYADVILARGLWDKYGLTMNEEASQGRLLLLRQLRSCFPTNQRHRQGK